MARKLNPTMLSENWLLLVTLWWVTLFFFFLFKRRGRIQPPLPPGPPGLPVVGSLPFLKSELHSYFAGLTRRYGALVSLRLGSKVTVLVGSPSLAKQVLRDFDVTFANRDVMAAVRDSTHGGLDMVWSPYGAAWRSLRKVCAHGMLGSAALDSMCNLRTHEVEQTMVGLLEEEGCSVNIGEKMFLAAFNVVTAMLWGGSLKSEERARVGAEFRAIISEIVHLVGSPNVSDFFPLLARFDLQGIVKKTRDCSQKLEDVYEALIDERRGGDSGVHHKDFLQFLLELEDGRDPQMSLTMPQLRYLLTDMIFAGTETTSNTVEFAMAEILNNPEIQRKVQQELEQVVGDGNQVEESHVYKLHYLQATMKETLRLHPVIPLLIPRCPSEPCIVGGYTIPKGSTIFINVWAIQRDPLLWEDPHEFKPERFLNKNYNFSGNDFAYFPFGSGRRICAGIMLAERMVLVALASLMHYFDWKLPEGTVKLDLSEKFGPTLEMRTPLLLVPYPRASNLNGLKPASM